jgi:hypothetical protein
MGRGSNLADGKVVIDEGWNAAGIHTALIFEGDQMVVKRSYDADPILEDARIKREANEGKGWKKDGFTHVGVIPLLDYYKLIHPIRDRAKRQAALRDYFRANTKLATFDKYTKRA